MSFGKKAGEREAVDRHLETVRASGSSHFLFGRKMSFVCKAYMYGVTGPLRFPNFVTVLSREPTRLLLYTESIVQFCRNLSTTQQGSLAIDDYETSSPSCVSVFVAQPPAGALK